MLRPEELVKHRYAVANGSATPESLAPVEQQAIHDIVKLQQECGIRGITNGEYPRHFFWGTFFETLNSMDEVNLQPGGYDTSIIRTYAPDVEPFMHEKTIPNAVTVATGKIPHPGKSSFLSEFEFMKTVVPQDQWGGIKLTMTSPSWYHFRYGPRKAYTNNAYRIDDE